MPKLKKDIIIEQQEPSENLAVVENELTTEVPLDNYSKIMKNRYIKLLLLIAGAAYSFILAISLLQAITPGPIINGLFEFAEFLKVDLLFGQLAGFLNKGVIFISLLWVVPMVLVTIGIAFLCYAQIDRKFSKLIGIDILEVGTWIYFIYTLVFMTLCFAVSIFTWSWVSEQSFIYAVIAVLAINGVLVYGLVYILAVYRSLRRIKKTLKTNVITKISGFVAVTHVIVVVGLLSNVIGANNIDWLLLDIANILFYGITAGLIFHYNYQVKLMKNQEN